MTGGPTLRGVPVVEFSRLIALEPANINHGGGHAFNIEADDGERAALAMRFGLESLDHFSAQGNLEVEAGGKRAVLEVRFAAELTQSCVVTMEPVADRIKESFTAVYIAPEPSDADGEVDIDPEAEDPPEPLAPEGVDVGDAVAERLGLAIEPYPRAPGASVPDTVAAEVETEDPEKDSPFAILRRLKG
jgi:uncharacterized metal-binding protein YceD (DUF177 family)